MTHARLLFVPVGDNTTRLYFKDKEILLAPRLVRAL